MGVELLNLSCGLLPETSPVPSFFIAPLNFISLIKCLCEKVEATVTVILSAPYAAQLTSRASEWCWTSVRHHGSRTDHSFNLGSMSAPTLLHCGPLAHWTPLEKMPPLSFYWDLRDTDLALGVLFLESPQPTHYLLFEGQLQNALKYPHVTRECWSSSALSIWEYHAFVIFLVPQVGWYVPRDRWRRCGCHGSLRLGSEPPFLTFSQECGFITVSSLPPLLSETLACYEGNESHMFLIHLHVTHQNVVL